MPRLEKIENRKKHEPVDLKNPNNLLSTVKSESIFPVLSEKKKNSTKKKIGQFLELDIENQDANISNL